MRNNYFQEMWVYGKKWPCKEELKYAKLNKNNRK